MGGRAALLGDVILAGPGFDEITGDGGERIAVGDTVTIISKGATGVLVGARVGDRRDTAVDVDVAGHVFRVRRDDVTKKSANPQHRRQWIPTMVDEDEEGDKDPAQRQQWIPRVDESKRRQRIPIMPGQNPKDPDDVPHVKTVGEVRRILAGIPKSDRCDKSCPGWGIFNEHEGRPEIQVCDECMTALPKHERLSDDDVAQLAEAQRELKAAEARVLEDVDDDLSKNPDDDDADLADFVRGKHKHNAIKRARLAYVVEGILRERGYEVRDRDEAELVELARQALSGAPGRNPAGVFTAKGERMYREIKKQYQGDPRAKEIAARTVYARAKDGVPGLVKKR